MIRYKNPDKKNALSIIESSKKEMEFTLTMEITEKSASTITRNIYESFMMLGDALLISKGIKAEDHITQIKALLKLKVETARPISLIDNLRRLRHNINYYGYRPKIEEVEDAVSLAKACFKPLFNAVQSEITA